MLVQGFDHVAVMSHNLDALIDFYDETMDVSFDGRFEHGLRHGFFDFGGSLLHVFEAPHDMTGDWLPADQMFRRGRIDHFAIKAVDEAALAKVRDRLLERGASPGIVTVFGTVLSVHGTDPEGLEFEVCCPWTRDVFGDDDVSLPTYGND